MKKSLTLAALLFTTSMVPAWGMPPVGAIIGGIAGAIGVSAATVGLIAINLAVSVVMSAVQRARMKKASAQSSGLKTERKLTGGVNSRSIMLGHYATAGAEVCPPMSQGNVNDTPNAYLTYVIALSDIPVGAMSNRLVMNGEWVPIDWETSNTYGSPIGDKYAGNAWIKFYDGTQTVADPMLLSTFGSYPNRPWTANHIGTGTAYAILTFLYDSELYKSEPECRFEIMGARLYDPREDSTVGGSGSHRLDDPATWGGEGDDNPVVMIYNILLGIPLGDGRKYGASATFDDLPLSNWVAAMNVCDELVNIQGGTEKRFRAGYEILVAEDEPGDVIDELLKACLGSIVEIGGVYKIRCGAPGLPVAFLQDGDFLTTKEQELDPFPATQESRNTLNASFPHPDELFLAHDAPTVTNQDYIDEDGDEIFTADIPMPAVPFPVQVQRTLQAWLKDDRRWRTHTGSLGPYGLQIEPLDTIEWTSERNGYLNKEFEVTASEENLSNLVIGLGFREVDPADYDWSPSMQLPDPVTPGGWEFPDAQAVPGFAVFAHVVRDEDNDPRKPAIRCVWDAGAAVDARALNIQWRRLGSDDESNKSVTRVSLGVTDLVDGILPATEYQVRAIYDVNRPKVWSSWLNVTTGDVKITEKDLAQEIWDEFEEIASQAGIEVYEDLPAEGKFPNQIIMLVPPGQLYRWDDDLGQWVTQIYAGIPDGAIDMTKLAQEIQPPLIWDEPELPTTKQDSEVLLFEGKLYRWNGSEYTSAVETVELVGQIVREQLANNAVTPDKMATVPGYNLSPDPTLQYADAWLAQPAWSLADGKWTFDPINAVWNTLSPLKSIPVAAGLRYRLRVQIDLLTATSSLARIWISWRDTNDVQVGQSGQNGIGISTSGSYQVEGVAPANAAQARIRIEIAGQSTDAPIDLTAFEFIHITSNVDLDDFAVTAQKLANGSVERNKIVDDAISSAKLADGAATAAKIATGAITQTKIEDGAISTPKLAAGAVTAGKIEAGAVTAGKIAADAVQAGNIAAGAVTAGTVQAGAIGADEIATGSILASKMAIADFANLVPDNQLQDASIWATNSRLSITAGFNWQNTPNQIRMQPGASTISAYGDYFPVEPDKEYFASFQMSFGPGTGLIEGRAYLVFYDYAGAVIGSTGSHLIQTVTSRSSAVYSNSITAPAGAVSARFRFYCPNDTANEFEIRAASPVVRLKNNGELIVDGAISSDKIAANAVTAGKILAGAVEADKIATNAVTAGKILAGSVTAAKIATDAVTADKINANAVTSDKIMANAITTAKIAAGAIGAEQVAAQAISARHLLIADFTNLVPNYDISDIDSWGIPSPWSRGVSGPVFDGAYLTGIDVTSGQTGNSSVVTSLEFSTNSGDEYFMSIQARMSSGTSGNLIYSVQWRDVAGASLGTPQIVNATVSSGSAQRFSNTMTAPSGAVRAIIRWHVNRSNTTGTMQVGSPTVRRLNGGELIVDGAITANKISAGAITSDSLATNAVVASKIAAGAVTAAKINVTNLAAINANLGAITAGSLNINNNFIVTAAGQATIRSGTSGSRLVLTNNRLDVYEGSTLMVRVGEL